MATLPFGRTEVSVDELRTLIDIEAAVELAADGEVEGPEERVNEFVKCVPDLLSWLEMEGRRYPWRQTADPWRVYIAEILLQRTRGDAVDKIYTEFMNQFPDPESLHAAQESEIRELIHTLGFVNHRTRTLRDVGEIFVSEYGGKVPNSVEGLKKPWRVGDYSARACQLFSRGAPMALVDANFARVFERLLGYVMPRQPHKSSEVYALLDALVPSDPDLARAFNLAVLDLGALICTPENPACESCPVNIACNYYNVNDTRRN